MYSTISHMLATYMLFSWVSSWSNQSQKWSPPRSPQTILGREALPWWWWADSSLMLSPFISLISILGPQVASKCSGCFSLAWKAILPPPSPPLNVSLKLNYTKVGFHDTNMITACIDPQSLMERVHTGPVVGRCSLVCLFTVWLRQSRAVLSLPAVRIFQWKLIKIEYLVSRPHQAYFKC